MSTAAVLSPSPVEKFFDNNGNPLAGGKVYTYAGGTSTPIATYTDNTASIQNANPITLNARGEAAIWLSPNISYKYVVQDSLGNVISTTDQITVSQLLTLFAGVDTGIAGSYILNFTASFSAYTNGIVLYFVPANSNTGASTVNVNGLGTVPITNPNGGALGANQIVAGQMVSMVYYQTGFQLQSLGTLSGTLIGTFGPEATVASATTTDLGTATAHVVAVSGTTTITSFGTSANVAAPIYVVRFKGSLTLTYGSNLILPNQENIVTNAGDACLCEYQGAGKWQVLIYQSAVISGANFLGTLTGMSAGGGPGAIYYIVAGQPSGYTVTLYTNGSALTGTSNTTAMTMTGLPAALTPAQTVTVTTLVENNSQTQTAAIATIGNTGVITFLVLGTSAGAYFYATVFGNTGTKGLGADWSITYPL